MSEVDDAIAAARASWSRISDTPAAVPRRQRRRATRSTRSTARLLATLAMIVVVAAAAIAILGSIATIAAVALLALVAVAAVALWPRDTAPRADRLRPDRLRTDRLRTVDLRTLPAQTDRWLRGERAALPPPAQHLVDRIGERLDTLSPQLARLAPEDEHALEVRRLVGEQLPAFVADYARVPAPLRRVERAGRTPDAALVDGLSVIEREIAALTQRLAADDLDSLATRGRYLEMRYPGDPPT